MAARFKLDENLPRDAHTLLADAGHDAHSASDEGLGGGPDSKVIEACLTENRILVTLDLDFADIRVYPPSSHRGIWVLRPPTQSVVNTVSVLRGALALLAAEPTDKRLWIVEPGRVRIRE
jgi:predicted nuclease of predicted toxin-antitoxin system